MEKGQPPPYPTYPSGPYPSGPNPSGPYPPQAAYIPQGGPNIVVTATPQAIPRYGPNPQPTICPHCHKQIITRVENDPTLRTHMMALVCCFMCCLPCIPYCIDSCQNRNHVCPSCGAFLGTYDDGESMRRW